MKKQTSVFESNGVAFSTRDTPENIQKCLSCRKEDCTNCLGGTCYAPRRTSPGKYHHHTPEEQNILKALIDSGKSYKEVCAVLYVGRTKYNRMKKEAMKA